MAESNKVFRISELNLSADQKQQVLEAASSAIAVGVYRELQRARQSALASDSGCQIAGNCSSCSSRNLD